MYEVLPSAVAWLTGWGIAAITVVRVAKGLIPLIRAMRAAVTLVNEQLAPNHGGSLVDKVDQAGKDAKAARQSADQTRSALSEHIRSDHGGGR